MCSHVVDLSCCCISDSTEYNILVSQSSADGLSEFSALGGSSEITSLGSRGDGIEAGGLDVGGDVHVVQVSQHHDGGEEKSGWVGLVLTSDIWGGAVDRFEEGDAISTDVSRWGETETTDQTSSKIGEDITVKVGHDEHVVLGGILDDSEADSVEVGVFKLDVGVLFGDFSGNSEEGTVGLSHDVGLVDAGDSVPTVLSSVLESVLADVSGGGLSDELDGLDDAWDDLVLDAGVLTFSVFSDGDDVDVIVFGLVANDGLAWSNVGVKAEGLSEHEVHGGVASADGSGKGTLKTDLVLVDGFPSGLRENPAAVWLLDSVNVSLFPIDWSPSGVEDLGNSSRDLWADTVARNQSASVLGSSRHHSGNISQKLRHFWYSVRQSKSDSKMG